MIKCHCGEEAKAVNFFGYYYNYQCSNGHYTPIRDPEVVSNLIAEIEKRDDFIKELADCYLKSHATIADAEDYPKVQQMILSAFKSEMDS